METRYFEIYVGGRNGFSTYVQTDKEMPLHFVDDEILDLAVKAKVIEPDDAKEVAAENGYVEEIEPADLAERVPANMLHTI